MRIPMVAAALVLCLGTGCIEPAHPNTPPGARLAVIEDPSDYLSYDAQPEGTLFLHDYWRGKSSFPLIDRTVAWRTAAVTSRYVNGPALYPDESVLVPPGARWVNITVDTSRLHRSPGILYLDITTAALATRIEVPSDGRLRLEPTRAMADREHQVLSAWSFRLVHHLPNAGPYYIVGDFWLRVEVARGLNLVPRPDPRDLPWNASEQVLIKDGTVGPVLAGVCVTDCLPVVVPQRPVPLGTTHVLVKLTHRGIQASALTEPTLQYHPANSRTWTTLAAIGSGAVREYRIEVASARMSDSPFADYSAWAFRLINEKLSSSQFAEGYDFVVEAHAYR